MSCNRCGRTTNTAVSNHIDGRWPGEKAEYCYAAWYNGKWVRGCAKDEEYDDFMSGFIEKLLKEQRG
jgi:hypothetical protein